VVAQFDEVLRYKPVLPVEFFIDLIFRPHYGPWVD
jgi:hypothetical protein